MSERCIDLEVIFSVPESMLGRHLSEDNLPEMLLKELEYLLDDEVEAGLLINLHRVSEGIIS